MIIAMTMVETRSVSLGRGGGWGASRVSGAGCSITTVVCRIFMIIAMLARIICIHCLLVDYCTLVAALEEEQ